MRAVALSVALLALGMVAPAWAQPADVQDPATLDWSPIGAAVQGQIAAGQLPGAVVVVGDAHRIWLRQAWGWRARVPQPEPMTPDTVFDLASLTKAVATTTAVMQLVEKGRLKLDEPAARYWPAFGANGKGRITVGQLLSHTSGLRPDLDLRQPWSGHAEAVRRTVQETPVAEPGLRMVYSDINFFVLGELVHRVSKMSLNAYCRRFVFQPLGMRDAGFLPGLNLWPRVAPTSFDGRRLLRGVVHDPTARRAGGVAGHAGLFGTADDMARFAQALLNRGSLEGHRVLNEATVNELLLPRSPRDQLQWRGWGWQLDAPLSPDRDELTPAGMLGHTGYTGTGLWIDFAQGRFVVILSSRVHPGGGGDARPLRREILALVSSVAPPLGPKRLAQLDARLAGEQRPPPTAEEGKAVATGIDVLRAERYASLTGKRIGLITNRAAIDAHGWRTLDRLRHAEGVTLLRAFTPEHGFGADQEGRIASGREPLSGLPLVSLYGATRRPTPEMLQGLDALVFDIPDAGARFFTYISTLGLAMEAAAEAGLEFVVLDRPNPVGDRVGGPVIDADLLSFTGYARLPVQHGMTVGELAKMFKDELRERTGRDVNLRVVPMRNYRRGMRFEQTGLDWVPPSPNLRTPATALLYPGTAWVEGANVSVGRGTEHPFEWIGAPWIDGKRLARELDAQGLPGVAFTPIDFTPDAAPYRGKPCHGVAVRLTDKAAFDAPRLGLALTHALWRLWPKDFQLDRTLGMPGSRETLQAIRDGAAVDEIVRSWEPQLEEFRSRRRGYLLY